MIEPSTLALRELRTQVRHASLASGSAHELHRLHCVYLVALGHSCREVAIWFGDGARSVQRWVAASAQREPGETSALARPEGRPPRLGVAVVLQLQLELLDRPCQCGFSKANWYGRLVRQHLREHYGVSLGLRQCQRVLHQALLNAGDGADRPSGPPH